MTLHNAAQAAQNFLERTGLEPTLNRILIFSALADSPHPLTAREVYEAVLGEHKINRVTVYRILDMLADKGAVNRVSSGERALQFCTGRNHSHFHCTSCGCVQCIQNDALHFDEEAVASALPLHISTIALHLEGVCADCRGGASSAKP